MMAILTLLTSRSWLVLRLSTGWGGRGRDIVSRRAENSVLNCYFVLFLCTDLFDTNQPPNFLSFIWHRPHLKSLLCLGRSCFCQLGASCLLLVVISCWLCAWVCGLYLCMIQISDNSNLTSQICINSNPVWSKFKMFGKYMYLETPSWRIVRRIRVVQFILLWIWNPLCKEQLLRFTFELKIKKSF